jgi:hypothetical protein
MARDADGIKISNKIAIIKQFKRTMDTLRVD